MAYVAPTLADFSDRYVEFAAVLPSEVEAVLADATADVSTLWTEADYPRAIMLLTAHMLIVEGYLERVGGKTSTVTSRGQITSKQVGDVKVTYSGTASSASSSGSSYTDGYGQTEYGRRYLALMRRNFSGPVVV